ncbi:rhomboid family intramembrane serine protease [archaeon]|nr:MAG: rhomboid family intramembrane serine protease [archaeon]
MNWMNLPLVLILTICMSFLACLYYIHRPVRCAINGSHSIIDGLYMGRSNYYEKVGADSLSSLPDILYYFDILRTKHSPPILILQANQAWAIATPEKDSNNRLISLYVTQNSVSSPLYPPSKGWMKTDSEKVNFDFGSQIGTVVCHGGSIHTTQSPSNLQQLLDSPMNTFILASLIYIAYLLWEYRTEVSAVSFSYESLVQRGEYWRAITASVAHFDLLHLGFNTMALYQFRMLESVYGSLVYGYLSMALLVITMCICVGLYHILIYKYNLTNYINQQAVGYSCVLFAWMVALSVRLETFCPIFLFPSFCLPTYYIPFIHLPVNLGPFVLLVFTSLIMPRASFIGHLSGIIIGYPLAWGMLNFLTPPFLMSFLCLVYMHIHTLYYCKLASPANTLFSESEQLPTVVEVSTSRLAEKYQKLQIGTYTLLSLLVMDIFLLGIDQAFYRLVLIFSLWNALNARYIEFYEPNRESQHKLGLALVCALLMLVFALFYDALNLSIVVFAYEHLVLFGLSSLFAAGAGAILLVQLILELVVICSLLECLDDFGSYAGLLVSYSCDSRSIKKWTEYFNVRRYFVSTTFQGGSNRLGGSNVVGGQVYEPVALEDPNPMRSNEGNHRVAAESKASGPGTALSKSRTGEERVIHV